MKSSYKNYNQTSDVDLVNCKESSFVGFKWTIFFNWSNYNKLFNKLSQSSVNPIFNWLIELRPILLNNLKNWV